jgi:hypothetical protein
LTAPLCRIAEVPHSPASMDPDAGAAAVQVVEVFQAEVDRRSQESHV